MAAHIESGSARVVLSTVTFVEHFLNLVWISAKQIKLLLLLVVVLPSNFNVDHLIYSDKQTESRIQLNTEIEMKVYEYKW